MSGASVVLADVNMAAAEQAVGDLAADGYKAIAVCCDTSDEA